MRLNWKAIFPALLVLITTSCFEKAPAYSVLPEIEFSNLCFSEGFNSSTNFTSDTLSLTLKFKDGDGDLGLSASNPIDNNFPFNEKFYFQKQGGATKKVSSNLGTSMVSYKDKRTNPLYSNLPDFISPYSCTNWEVIKDTNISSPKILDTLYIEYNPNHYNILIDFYIKNNDGTFSKFDLSKPYVYPNCYVAGFNGRFPVLSNDVSRQSPLEGILNYKMKSLGLKLTFSIRTLKVKVRITDRALNLSNEVESPEFNLSSIKCN